MHVCCNIETCMRTILSNSQDNVGGSETVFIHLATKWFLFTVLVAISLLGSVSRIAAATATFVATAASAAATASAATATATATTAPPATTSPSPTRLRGCGVIVHDSLNIAFKQTTPIREHLTSMIIDQCKVGTNLALSARLFGCGGVLDCGGVKSDAIKREFGLDLL